MGEFALTTLWVFDRVGCLFRSLLSRVSATSLTPRIWRCGDMHWLGTYATPSGLPLFVFSSPTAAPGQPVRGRHLNLPPSDMPEHYSIFLWEQVKQPFAN